MTEQSWFSILIHKISDFQTNQHIMCALLWIKKRHNSVTYESPRWLNFHGSVREDRDRRSNVWCRLTSLHSIFLGGQTAVVRHWKVAEQPAVSDSSCGLPWPAEWSQVNSMDDSRLLEAEGKERGWLRQWNAVTVVLLGLRIFCWIMSLLLPHSRHQGTMLRINWMNEPHHYCNQSPIAEPPVQL